MEFRVLLAVLSLIGALRLSAQAPAFDLAIRHARLVHGDGRVTPRATVFVRSGRIGRVDLSAAADQIPARRTIEAGGRTLLPGLIDAHVHLEPWAAPVFLKFGVTAVRDAHNTPDVIFPLAQAESPLRPRIVAAGAMLDGPGSPWPNATVVSDIASVRAAVRRRIESGAGVIKVHTRLSSSMIAAVVQEARARGVPVAAHLGRATAIQAAVAGVTSIEHLSGISEAASDDPRLARVHDEFVDGWTASELEWLRLRSTALEQVARMLTERGVVIVPTLVLHEAHARLTQPGLRTDPALADVPDEVREAWASSEIMKRGRWTPETVALFAKVMPMLQRFVRLFVQLGGRVVAGTDASRPFVIPGASLHRELELYVAAGLTPAQALRSATADAADLLGIASRAGTIDVGKDADLVLVEGDPLKDIRATRRVVAVVRMGMVAR